MDIDTVFDINKRILPCFKRKEKKIVKKKLADSEFVETCHEQVTNSLISRFTVFARITT